MRKTRNPYHFRRSPLLFVKASHAKACLSSLNRLSLQRLSLFMILAVVIGSSLLSALVPTLPVGAILAPTGSGGGAPGKTVASGFTLDQEIESLSYYQALTKGCIDYNMHDSWVIAGTANGNAVPSTWFDSDGYGFVYPSGKLSCADIATKALVLWGYKDDNQLFLKDIGYTYNNKTARWTQPSGGNTARLPAFEYAVNANVYGVANSTYRPSLSDAAHYLMAYTYFIGTSCLAKSIGAFSAMSNNPTLVGWVQNNQTFNANDPAAHVPGIDKGEITYTKITFVTPEKTKEVYGFVYQSRGEAPIGTVVTTAPATFAILYGYQEYTNLNNDNGKPTTRTCANLAKDLTLYAPAYYAWAIDPANNDKKVVGPPNVLDATCLKSGTPCDKGTTSCVLEGVGWFVCSAANFVARAADSVYGLIEHLLSLPVVNTNISKGEDGVYNTWAIMRNFANVAFVIGFLIIIFSQLTSVGVTNYGVKKTLPRLIVAAVLVNISFWIGAIAVDLSNIVGTGLYEAMSGVKGSMNININDNWGKILTGLLGGATLTVATGIVSVGAVSALVAAGGGLSILFLVLPLVLSALLAVFVAAFILIARQALVVILIIVSPIAFVALLLPNTEKLFSKWRSALLSVLIMYPIISLVFGGAQIAGLAIMSTAKAGDDPIAAILPIIIGQTVMVIPFFFLPTLIMKFSGNNLSGFASNIMKKGQGLIGGINAKARKEGMSRLGRSVNMMKYGANEPTGKVGSRVRRAGRWLDNIKNGQAVTDGYIQEKRQEAFRGLLGTPGPDGKIVTSDFTKKAVGGDDVAADAIASRAIASAEAEELKKALQPLIRELAGMDPKNKDTHLKAEIQQGGTRAAAALHYSASIGDTGFMREQIKSADTLMASSSDSDKRRGTEMRRQAFEAINANSGAILAKAPDLVKGPETAFGNVKGADMASFSKDTAKAYMQHLGTLSGDELKTGLSGFNSAVQDIANSPELQGKFSGETGNMIWEHAKDKLPRSIMSSMSGLSKIDGNGKIRP